MANWRERAWKQQLDRIGALLEPVKNRMDLMVRWQPSRDLALIGRPSALGLALGAIAFAASLTPSLIPRPGLVQGALGGICFALGYLAGWAMVLVLDWIFERPQPPAARLRLYSLLGVTLAVLVMVWALGNVTAWQNDIHAAMSIPAVESARPLTILGITAVVALALILCGRVFRRIWRVIAAQLEPFIPRRLAQAVGLVLVLSLFYSVGNDMVLGRFLAALDETYAKVDALVPVDVAPPSDPLKMGSAASLSDWEGLGAEGRNWVLDPINAAVITELTGAQALEPLRIYVGLNNADTAERRAALALQEAIRVGAFARKRLVIATPTGTGWMDPAGMRPLEILSGGDVATVAVQYSYLPSWMSLIVQPQYGAETADAVFRHFYSHWRSLPEAQRPEIYLFGLSLGVRNGELAVSWPELVGAPVDGMLWVGPPFAARGWQQTLAGREADSAAWAPRLGNGSVVRVKTQAGYPLPNPALWGPMRVIYLEYPSDPIVFFSPGILWRAPNWLGASRGPDVSASFRWYPVVTMLQLVVDMMIATSTPPGYGHVYAARDYLTAWDEVLERDMNPELAQILTGYFESDGI